MILNPISYEKIDYKLLKIKPDSRLTKNSYEELINIFHSTYQPFINRLQNFKYTTSKNNGYFSIENNHPISYEVLFDGDNIKHSPTFYFGIPYTLDQYLKQRIQTTFPNSTLTFENDSLLKLIDTQFKDCYTYEFFYVKNNILSIKTGENRFFESLLTIKNSIQKGDCILFQVELTPIGDYWKSFNEDKWNEIRNGKDVVNKVSKMDKIVNTTLSLSNQALDIFNLLLEDIVVDSSSTNAKSIVTSNNIKLQDFSTASRQKSNYDGFKTSIRLYVSTNSKLKADNYSSIVNVALKEVEEDNRFQCKYNKHIKSIKRGDLKNKTNLLSTKELCTLINIPNQKIQRTFNIDSINMKVNNIPKELICDDYIRIGTDEFHGETRTICLPKTKRNRCLSRVYLSSMGSGKSNIFLNNIVDSIKYNNGVFVLDHINVCELTKGMVDIYGNKIVVRNPKDEKEGFGFYFPELPITENMSINDRLDVANDIAYEVQYLINSIATNTENLSEIMTNYLFSACKIIFCHYGKTLQDFIDVLLNQKVRHEYIDLGIEQGLFTSDSYEIIQLMKLDKDDKPIKGLLDRICVLQRDTLFSRMLRKPYNDNDSFIKYFDNCIPVSITMSNEDFPNKKKKDILSTFLLSRVRLAMMKRKNRNMITDIYIDEPQSLKHSMELINDSVFEVRKYGISYVLAIQGINQLGVLKDGLLDAGCHWFLLKGCNEQTFNELKFKIGDEFDYNDLIEMEKWHSFNIVSIDSNNHCFITKYPEPLRNKQGKLYIGD